MIDPRFGYPRYSSYAIPYAKKELVVAMRELYD